VNRTLTTADLNVADTDTTGACGLHAAVDSNPGSALETGFLSSEEKPGFQGRNRGECDLVFALAGTADVPLGSRQLPGGSSEPSRIRNAIPVDAVFAAVSERPVLAGASQRDSDDPMFDVENLHDYVPADFSWQEQ